VKANDNEKRIKRKDAQNIENPSSNKEFSSHRSRVDDDEESDERPCSSGSKLFL